MVSHGDELQAACWPGLSTARPLVHGNGMDLQVPDGVFEIYAVRWRVEGVGRRRFAQVQ